MPADPRELRAARRRASDEDGQSERGEGTRECIAVIYKFEGRRLTLSDVDRQACHLAVLLRLFSPCAPETFQLGQVHVCPSAERFAAPTCEPASTSDDDDGDADY